MSFLFTVPSWEVIMGPAPIDWCEENFTRSHSIAEIYNTITNFVYLLAPAALLLLHNKKKHRLCPYENNIFVFYCFSMFFTGVTSGLFHATLLWWTQKADEMFETWTVLTLFHAASTSEKKKKDGVPDARSYLSIFPLHLVLATLGIWCIPVAFCEIHLFLLCLGTSIRFSRCAYALDIGSPTPATIKYRRKLLKVLFCAVIGFAAWLCDFFACSTFKGLYLHAFGWHLLTCLALFEAGLLLEAILLHRPISIRDARGYQVIQVRKAMM